MTSITVTDIDPALEARLRRQAASHGRSMEEEARDILRAALPPHPAPTHRLAHSIRNRFSQLGGVELPAVPREPIRDSPSFDQ